MLGYLKTGLRRLVQRMAAAARRFPYMRSLLRRFIARYPQLALPFVRLVSDRPVSPFAQVLDIEQQSTRTRAVHARLVEQIGRRRG